ncbi:MAG: hypothetical protein ABIP78_03030, partial [Pyrinomonadaceae bacterium]
FGAVAAFLAVAVIGLTSGDAQVLVAADLAMYMVGWYVILPAALGSLLTGLVQSLGTQWGLFRHYWIVAKLMLTVFATAVLLFKMQLITLLAGVSSGTLATQLSVADLRQLRVELLGHAIGGMIVLLSATVLSVYKPWGATRFGKCKLQEQRMNSTSVPFLPDSQSVSNRKIVRRPATGIPRWAYVVGVHIAGIAVVMIVLHVTGFVGSH